MSPGMTVSRLSRAKQVREKRIKLGGLLRIPEALPVPRRPRMFVEPDGSEFAPVAKPHRDGTLVKAQARAWRGEAAGTAIHANLAGTIKSASAHPSHEPIQGCRRAT